MRIERRIQSFLNHEYPSFCSPQKMEQATEKENTSKMEKLEKTISEMMYATFENDSEKKYIYADVQEKNKDEDIVLFILKSTAKHLDISSEQLLQLINKHSFCSTNTPFTMFEEYQSALQNLIEQKKKELPDKDVENIILNIECSNFFELIRDITEGLHKQMFLLLDHITTLTKQEQQRVNQLISWRWQLSWGVGILPKINNGTQGRSVYRNTDGHPIQDPHDYTTHSVPLEEIN